MSDTNGNGRDYTGLYADGLDPIAAKRRKVTANTLGRGPWESRTELSNLFDDPRRDINFECGYPDTTAWSADNYYDLYEREPLMTRAVQLMAKEAWQSSPIIKDSAADDGKPTPFTQGIENLGSELRGGWHSKSEGGVLNEYFCRVDELSGIGSFGIMLLGFDDGRSLEQPVQGMVDVTSTVIATNLRTGERMTVNQMRRQCDDVVRCRQQYAEDAKRSGGSQWKMRPPRQDRYSVKTVTSKRPLAADSPTHPGEEAWLQDPPQVRVHDGWTPRVSPTGEPVRDGGREKYRKVAATRPLTANERWVLGGWVRDRQSAVDSAAAKMASGMTFNELSSSESAVVAGGLVDDAAVQNAARKAKKKPVGNPKVSRPVTPDYSDPIVGDSQMQPDGTVRPLNGTLPSGGNPGAAEGNPNDPYVGGTDSVGYGSGFDPSGLEDDQHRRDGDRSIVEVAPGVGGLRSDTVGEQVGSMGGTEAQYFGTQMGPSEMSGGGETAGDRPQRKLLFIRCFAENLVQVVRYEWNSRNPRFGLPVMYRVTLNDPREVHSGVGLPLATVFVHWTRVIHVAKNLNSSEVFGVPVGRPILNCLLDAKKVRAACAEATWRNAVTRISWETNPQLGGDVRVDMDEFRDMLENADNSMQRDVVTSGLSAHQLTPNVSDPSGPYNILQQTICTQLGVPLRIWQGAERGQLASQQDDSNWNDRVTHWCNTWETPRLICPFVDRMIAVGVLPEPEEGYAVEWPDREAMGDQVKASIATQVTGALANYAQSGLEALISRRDYLTKVQHFTDDEADAIIANQRKDDKNAYDIDAAQLRGAGGVGGLIALFSDLKNGALSEGAFKNIIMLAFGVSEEDADQMVDDATATSVADEEKKQDLLGDAASASVAMQKTQAMATYLSGGLSAMIDQADYLAAFIGIPEYQAQAYIDKAQAAQQQQQEEQAQQQVDAAAQQSPPPQPDQQSQAGQPAGGSAPAGAAAPPPTQGGTTAQPAGSAGAGAAPGGGPPTSSPTGNEADEWAEDAYADQHDFVGGTCADCGVSETWLANCRDPLHRGPCSGSKRGGGDGKAPVGRVIAKTAGDGGDPKESRAAIKKFLADLSAPDTETFTDPKDATVPHPDGFGTQVIKTLRGQKIINRLIAAKAAEVRGRIVAGLARVRPDYVEDAR